MSTWNVLISLCQKFQEKYNSKWQIAQTSYDETFVYKLSRYVSHWSCLFFNNKKNNFKEYFYLYFTVKVFDSN